MLHQHLFSPKAYLESFHSFCEKMGGATKDLMCPVLEVHQLRGLDLLNFFLHTLHIQRFAENAPSVCECAAVWGRQTGLHHHSELLRDRSQRCRQECAVSILWQTLPRRAATAGQGRGPRAGQSRGRLLPSESDLVSNGGCCVVMSDTWLTLT